MSVERELLEQERDQALADIIDLDRQVAEREIPQDTAETLRRRYEAAAARAIEALETRPQEEPSRPARAPRRSRARLAAYVIAAAVAVFAAVVVLPQYVGQRPDGGFVTGNEAAQQPSGNAQASPPPRDLSKVTEAEMEAVIKANPEVLGMRLALAGRYVQKGQYDKAADHYGVALQQAPNDPRVQAGVGWLLFKMGSPDKGLRYVDQALAATPDSQDALWYKANILFEGRKDPAGALAILRELDERGDLTTERRRQVEKLIAAAEQAAGR